MQRDVFLLTAPFTQLNTPYPATTYLKGFLNTKGIVSFQADLGIEVTNAMFSRAGLAEIFEAVGSPAAVSANAQRIIALKQQYIDSIDAVVQFLQDKNPALAPLIANGSFLPQASRFEQLDDIKTAFGTMGTHDQAKYIATMYLEDLSDLVKECLDANFGFSRYAERLGRSANSFDELHTALQGPHSYIDGVMITILGQKIEELQPKLVAVSIPFPGNLYCSLRCGQWIKTHYPETKVAFGGGFANTELRSLSDPRVFDYCDFICLDDGEAPMEQLVNFVCRGGTEDTLKRTFIRRSGVVEYRNNTVVKDYKQGEVGTPDYSDLLLDKYISAIEIVNPMHSLWTNGRWNKLTMAHGCYWGKCTFCDISLDYIRLYEPVAAELLCDRMETLIAQTGYTGFHFVDEAAPPALMRALSLEILKRRLVVTWWANIRFEKSFSRDLCLLLKAAGCIAVSGGLEVASDRLLKLIDKGITVAQVAKVNQHFHEAGIMVHAYLMYGFPTQTAQETIDSLEMVRQMFETGVLQSAFWHQFTMTAHSPVGLDPAKYRVRKLNDDVGSFANNDLVHEDPTGAEHELFSFGLKKSLLNYMHGTCFDHPLQKWFDFKVPKTSVDPAHIRTILENPEYIPAKDSDKIVWIGNAPSSSYTTKSKKGQQWEIATLQFHHKLHNLEIKVGKAEGEWLTGILKQVSIHNGNVQTLKQVRESYEAAGLEDFDLFWDNKPVNTLYKVGLLRL